MANRNDILNLLATGQISADEAARLLREPAGQPHEPLEPATPPVPARPADSNRWLHVRVSDLSTGRQRVNVNLPLSWVQIGMKIGARYSPEMPDIDWNDLVQQIQAGANGKLVEVEDVDDNERVEIYVD